MQIVKHAAAIQLCDANGSAKSIIDVNLNRDSPNGYPTVTPTELQPVTLAH